MKTFDKTRRENTLTNRLYINKLNEKKLLSKEEWISLLSSFTDDDKEYAASLAREISNKIYKNEIFMRGLIEISNYCKNDCFYCGIRCSNKNAVRYRLSKEDILMCADGGYALGFRTFVLQGGEDLYYTDEIMCDIIKSLKEKYPDCAITLSLGEKTRETYQKYFDAGADRYLVRHETANETHYAKLHPKKMSLKTRKECLNNLKSIGFQVGAGFMVGSPYQTIENIAEDMIFLSDFKPHMIGIGPFIPHKDTPFAGFATGDIRLTLFLLSLARIMLPSVLLPATTALGTAEKDGRIKGVLAGANVIMPNLSPQSVREKYMLYDNKIGIKGSTVSHKTEIAEKLQKIGYKTVVSRGDYIEKGE